MSDCLVWDDMVFIMELIFKVIWSFCIKQNVDGEQVIGEFVGNSKGVGSNCCVFVEKLMFVVGYVLFVQISGDKDFVECIFYGFQYCNMFIGDIFCCLIVFC